MMLHDLRRGGQHRRDEQEPLFARKGFRGRLQTLHATLRNTTRPVTYDRKGGTTAPDRLADRLRAEQYRHFRGETWLSSESIFGHDMEEGVRESSAVCGGMGMRMREFSEAPPKPMAPIGDRPISWHVMKYYAHFGHRDSILCLGYKADVIKRYFLDWQRVSVQ